MTDLARLRSDLRTFSLAIDVPVLVLHGTRATRFDHEGRHDEDAFAPLGREVYDADPRSNIVDKPR